jgi:hypothetical protein
MSSIAFEEGTFLITDLPDLAICLAPGSLARAGKAYFETLGSLTTPRQGCMGRMRRRDVRPSSDSEIANEKARGGFLRAGS